MSQYGTATLDGTPTAAGTYTLNLVAYEYNNGTGLATPQYSYTVNVSCRHIASGLHDAAGIPGRATPEQA